MGYVEETGVAQHFRDARITPIYEGTNGIQAMDLVGRKLPMRGGGVMADFLAEIRGLDAPAGRGRRRPARRSGPTWPTPSTRCPRRPTGCCSTARDDVRDALAGATPYLRMFALVAGGWLMARQALAAQGAARRRATATPRCSRPRSPRPASTPSSCCPAVPGLAGPATAGFEDLFAVDPAYLAG